MNSIAETAEIIKQGRLVGQFDSILLYELPALTGNKMQGGYITHNTVREVRVTQSEYDAYLMANLPRCGDYAVEFAEETGSTYSDSLVYCNMD